MKKLTTITIVIVLFFFLIFTFFFLIKLNSKDIEVGFSPGKSAHKIVLTAIQEAKKSIDIAVYSFTNKSIALALIAAQQRGVNVRMVADAKLNSKRYTALIYLKNYYIQIRFNDKYLIMHNKFIIIDGHSVATGSFNYTQGAVYRNAENVIYLHNWSDIAKQYTQEFNRLWNEAVSIDYYVYT